MYNRHILAIALISGLLASSASASILTSDTFSYPNGSLVGNGGWVNHSGTVGSLLVSGGQAVVREDNSATEDANKPFTNVPGSLYYGIDFSVDNLGTPIIDDGTPDFEYFAHFSDGGTTIFTGRLDVVARGGAGDFRVGISTASGTAEATWGADLMFATTYRAIVKYDQVADQAQLWINALVDTDPSILGADLVDPGDTISAFALRQSDSDANELVRVDNLIVATTFAEVVPEPATVTLLGLGLIGLIRRRR